MNIKFDAEVMRLGLITGFYNLSQVGEWAEAIISQEEELEEYDIYDVVGAANSDVSNISQVLSKVSRGTLEFQAVKAELFSRLLKESEGSQSGARRAASSLSNLASLVDGEAELSSFRDQYDDFDAGIYGVESEIRSNIIEFLKANS